MPTLSFGPKGALMITGGTDKEVRIWKTKGLDQVAKLSGHVSTLYASAVHPAGKLAATADASGKLILWNLEGEKNVWTVEVGGRLNGLAFDPNGELLYGGGKPGVLCWDVKTGEARSKIRWEEGTAGSLAMHPDGRTLAWTSAGKLRVWSLAGDELVHTIETPEGGPYPVALHPNRPLAATGATDGSLSVWSLATGELVQRVEAHDDKIYGLAFNPAGDVLASGSEDKRIRLWKVRP